jgi:hypothetical protein
MRQPEHLYRRRATVTAQFERRLSICCHAHRWGGLENRGKLLIGNTVRYDEISDQLFEA